MTFTTDDLYNVFMFFPDGSYNQERSWVPVQEAIECARDCMQRPAVQLGIIRRVIITDADDFTCFEWKHGEGITYPPHKSQREKTDE